MKDILLNVLFILLVMFVTQHLLEWKGKKVSNKEKLIFIFFASLISIGFCMLFSISINDQYRYDLRAIPFIIGSLYGGPVVGVGLFLATMIFRLFIGINLGFLGAFLNLGLLTIIVCLFYKSFTNVGLKKRIGILTLIVLSHAFISRLIYTQIFVASFPLIQFLESSIIKVMTSLLIVLTIERIRQTHQLRSKMEDIEKMEIISHLSASISHEVRNGLTGAMGFIQLLRGMEKDEKKRKYIKIALSELERTENIIKDFLSFAKPIQQQSQEINMMHIMRDTIKIIYPLANMNSVEIKQHLIPFFINGDERLLQQSIINILKNAIEAMPNGGLLEINMSSKENELEISIKDTGIGMTKEQLESLGKPYFTTKGKKGTGLGMMVSLSVIEKLNGTIDVKSQVGKGSTFTIKFQRCQTGHEVKLFEQLS